MKKIIKLSCALVASAVLVACGGDDDDDAQSVYDVTAANEDFQTLKTAIDTAGLDETLDDLDSTFTVFAPTDAAFALLGSDTITALLADTDTLSDILLYHVISGAEVDDNAAIAAAGTRVEMANGDSVGLSLDGSSLLVNTVTVTQTNIEADNGIIHVLDAVLLPPSPTVTGEDIAATAGADIELMTLVSALGLTDTDLVALLQTDGPFTVFAPTDDAFDAVGAAQLKALTDDPAALEAILRNHVIDMASVDAVTAYTLNGLTAGTLGGDIAVNIDSDADALQIGGANVTTADIVATNGTIHKIDTVIVGGDSLPEVTIFDVASTNDDLETLAAALEANSLEGSTLAEILGDPEGSYTVFAPTDAAFDALGLESLTGLTDVLLYHVIGSEINEEAARAAAGTSVETLNGQSIAVSLDGGNLLVDGATVIQTDIETANGIIHVIDAVLLPES